mgnify:CR=1 FL=1
MNRGFQSVNVFVRAHAPSSAEVTALVAQRDLEKLLDQQERSMVQQGRILAAARRMNSLMDRLVVLGIGGSYMGARALMEGCCHPYHNELPRPCRRNRPRLYFEGNNVDNDSLAGLLGLAGFVQPFDMISMLGFLILMGTVVNNPILVVHRALQNAEAGLSPTAAVREALRTRLRPIAMSTITTLCGLAPLVLIPGAGTELYRGVGAIVMFGILGAMLVTLTMLPALTAKKSRGRPKRFQSSRAER